MSPLEERIAEAVVNACDGYADPAADGGMTIARAVVAVLPTADVSDEATPTDGSADLPTSPGSLVIAHTKRRPDRRMFILSASPDCWTQPEDVYGAIWHSQELLNPAPAQLLTDADLAENYRNAWESGRDAQAAAHAAELHGTVTTEYHNRMMNQAGAACEVLRAGRDAAFAEVDRLREQLSAAIEVHDELQTTAGGLHAKVEALRQSLRELSPSPAQMIVDERDAALAEAEALRAEVERLRGVTT